MAAMQLTRTHRILIALVVSGAVIIAAIGFAGSYAAVRELAERKGFGDFAVVFPIGIDAGICVLLALDLLLTWLRIPFPMLRQTAWLLTVATIAFNGAASWPDPLGVGMHAVIPVLFVVSVEAARHAVGRIADITADKHMEGVRITRWLLSPIPTFKLWRRMKLWELRSYEQVIKLEQDRLIYQARLQARYGRSWRRKAPVESMMPLRLAKYGVPLAETAPAGLAAAGIEPALLPPSPQPELQPQAQPAPQPPRQVRGTAQPELPPAQEWPEEHEQYPEPSQEQYENEPYEHEQHEQYAGPGPYGPEAQQRGPQQYPQYQEQGQYQDQGPYQEQAQAPAATHESPWFAAPQVPQEAYQEAYDNGFTPPSAEGLESSAVRVPAGPGRTRPLGGVVPGPRSESQEQMPLDGEAAEQPTDAADFREAAYPVFESYVKEHSDWPSTEQLDIHLSDAHGIRHPRSAALLRQLMPEFKNRFQADLEAEHIA
ncbi:DUF2637 domain-containing protein [Streptomyces sp. NPDC058685]|uniref:DUF2637 domain-containing protein n=1 Tax=Streptomyces sp. NPDC058685 TaxID=3346598 RepID=UPI00365A5528